MPAPYQYTALRYDYVDQSGARVRGGLIFDQRTRSWRGGGSVLPAKSRSRPVILKPVAAETEEAARRAFEDQVAVCLAESVR